MAMRVLRISKGGQISVPADVRKRWNTTTVEVDDHGDELVLRPGVADPIAAVRGLLADMPFTSDELRAHGRAEGLAKELRHAP